MSPHPGLPVAGGTRRTASAMVIAIVGLALAVGFLVAGVPAAALEPVDGPHPSIAPTCPSPWDGGSCLGPLAAGTYRTTVFEDPFTFTVPEGWANFEDLPGQVLLLPPGGILQGVDAETSDYIGIDRPVGVGVAGGTNCDGIEPGVGLDPASMAAALRTREGIHVTEPVPVEVAGLTGLMLDITDDPKSDAGCRDPEVSFPIKSIIAGMPPADFAHSIGPGITMRLYLLARGDSNFVIEVDDVANGPGTFEDYVPIIDSIELVTPEPSKQPEGSPAS